MPGSGRAELYFIAAMMILIVVVCIIAVYLFFKTYRKEIREKRLADQQRSAKQSRSEISNVGSEN